jgi:hypothetical protein
MKMSKKGGSPSKDSGGQKTAKVTSQSTKGSEPFGKTSAYKTKKKK